MKVIYALAACLLACSCGHLFSKSDLAVPVSANTPTAPVFSLTPGGSNIPADNATTVTITAAISNAGAYTNITQLTFATDEGLFSNGQKQYIAAVNNGQAVAYLKSSVAGTIKVTATLDTSSVQQAAISFVNALPTSILVEADNAILQNATDNITATFWHDNGDGGATQTQDVGTATQNQPVVFYDSAENSTLLTSVGAFSSTTAIGANGKATTTYQVQNTNYHGFVYIKAHVLNNVVLGVCKVSIP